MDKAVKGALRVVIAGAGTGGHLFPGIAVAEALRLRHPESRVLFITTGRPIEKRVLSRTDYETHRIRAAGFKGVGITGKLKALFLMPQGVIGAMRLLLWFKPHGVLGMGGYSAIPVLLSAWLLRIPRAIHEANRIAGMTNRFLAPFAERIYTSFPDTKIAGKSRALKFTGNPIRRAITGKNGKRAGEGERFTILILGGSQGAHTVNQAVIQALEYLRDRDAFYFIHQSGTADEKFVRRGYAAAGVQARVSSFFDDVANCYSSADLAVCRAGAATIAEVAAARLPAILIPYPHAADNHQFFNAKSLADRGAAEMIEQAELNGEALAARIMACWRNRSALSGLRERVAEFSRPEAADVLASDFFLIMKRRPAPAETGSRG
jgi:UDP-N-acetylglucosamine--N-acetylmuramyl-(pentapeptide) pyrophosphoryl-undecaprenol N-acetylglucosamine transferase